MISVIICSYQDLKVIYCEAQKFGAVNEKWTLKEFSLKNLASANIIFCSAFFKKDQWKTVGGYDEYLVNGLEDWDFWISTLKNGGNVWKLNRTCFFYRVKSDSMLQHLISNVVEKDNIYKYLEKKHFDFFQTYLRSKHYYNHKYLDLERKVNVIEKRFFYRVINKLYSVYENNLKKW